MFNYKTFQDCIKTLQQLNAKGYGQVESPLKINLIYNPQGAELPPHQSALEGDYKKHLFNNIDYKRGFEYLF